MTEHASQELKLPPEAWRVPYELPAWLLVGLAVGTLVVEVGAGITAMSSMLVRDAALIVAAIAAPSALLFNGAYIVSRRRRQRHLVAVAWVAASLNAVLILLLALLAVFAWLPFFQHGHH